MTAKDGKPCKKCGGNEWYRDGKCAACQRVRSRRGYAENTDKKRESTRRWQAANPDKKREIDRRWQAANREKVAEKDRRWRAANPEKAAERNRRWQVKNPEKAAKLNRRWQIANPEKVKAKDNRRRARKTQAGGSFTAAEWNALVAHQNGRCLACGKKAKLTADHIVPVSKGGSSNIENIQGLCGPCNSSKRDKTIDYRKDGGFLRWIQKKLF